MAIVRSILTGVKTCGSGLLDLLLPSVCPACNADAPAAGGLCDRCNVKLLALAALDYCPRCGASVGPNVKAYPEGCTLCPTTLGRFEQVVRLGPYADPLKAVIRGLKYRRQDAMLSRLSGLLAAAVSARVQRELDVVLHVPMHWRRRLSRGHDHAHLIASALAGRLNLPLGDELSRVKDNAPQAQLPRSRRLVNVKGAFAVRAARTLCGAHVLLVDDVTTTGATANEATRRLLEAGASLVTLAVLAKSEPPRAYAHLAAEV